MIGWWIRAVNNPLDGGGPSHPPSDNRDFDRFAGTNAYPFVSAKKAVERQHVSAAAVLAENLQLNFRRRLSLLEVSQYVVFLNHSKLIMRAVLKGKLIVAEERVLAASIEAPVADRGGLRATREVVRLDVTVSGYGIPSEHIERVFEPFFTTKELGKGTGLGLSQVFGFAKQSEGRVSITSVVGSGTTVSLFLPRAAGVPTASPCPKPAGSEALERKTVRLVEDNPEVADVTVGLLKVLNQDVTHVPNAFDAINTLTGGRISDLIISDIVMPGNMNGLEFARWIIENAPATPVILVTGYSSDAVAAQERGFKVLAKPFKLDHLINAVMRKLPKH